MKHGRKLMIDRRQLQDVIQELGSPNMRTLAEWVSELESDPTAPV